MAITYAYYLATKYLSKACYARNLTSQRSRISVLSAFHSSQRCIGYSTSSKSGDLECSNRFWKNHHKSGVQQRVCSNDAHTQSTRRYFSELASNTGKYQSINNESIISKWKFLQQSEYDLTNRSEDGGSNMIENILVCGDGDLSFSAEISSELDMLGITLYATVLEDEETHNNVYKFSKSNVQTIQSYPGHNVLFGIDATKLSNYFCEVENVSFDRIQFNFPHWRGKANNRYNRQLLNQFLKSAAEVLSPKGEIHVALCGGQGGCSATTLQDWKGSWTASMFAAEHGLITVREFPFDAQYNLSSHRGVDRPFHLGKDPKMYIFAKPDGVLSVPRDIQLCCRHELHVMVPNDDGVSSSCSLDQILSGDAIESIIQNIVPDGIRVEIPARKILSIPTEHGEDECIAVFLVVYCSEKAPLTRDMADEWRANTENEVSKYIPLRQNRKGRTVSRPFPYPALHPEIKYHTTGEK